MIETNTHNLNDVLYRYVSLSGIHKFIVIGVNATKYGTQYVLQDQACKHGWKCEVLCEYDKNNLRFVKMVNDHEDDSQHHLHTSIGGLEYYFKSKIEDVYIDVIKSNMSHIKQNIGDLERRLKASKDKLKQQELALKDAELLLSIIKTYGLDQKE